MSAESAFGLWAWPNEDSGRQKPVPATERLQIAKPPAGTTKPSKWIPSYCGNPSNRDLDCLQSDHSNTRRNGRWHGRDFASHRIQGRQFQTCANALRRDRSEERRVGKEC